MIPGVPPGQALEIIVQAVNSGLQGVPSDPVVFIAPTPAATPAVATELVPRPAAAMVVPTIKGANGRNGHHAPPALVG